MHSLGAESRLLPAAAPASRWAGRPNRQQRLQALVAHVMPHPAIPCEIVDGEARVRVGVDAPRVRLIVRDRARLKWLLLRQEPLLAFAIAFAECALDLEGDIFDAVRLKDNFPPSAPGVCQAAWHVLRW